jgi:uncharacterized protein (TIGR03083 family)
MVMTAQEFKRHRRSMDLEVVVEPVRGRQKVHYEVGDKQLELPAGHGLFELVSGCANLMADNRCSIYTTRPNCCRDFAVGSPACLKLRHDAGLDGDVVRADPSRPAVAPKPLNIVELRAAVASETSWLITQLEVLELRMWSKRTRCSGWDVSALVAHLVGVLQFAHGALSAVIENTNMQLPADFHAKGAATRDPFARAAEDVSISLETLAQDDLDRGVDVNDVVFSVNHIVQTLVMELAVHACDLAEALRLDRHLSVEAQRSIASALPYVLDSSRVPADVTSYVLVSDAFVLPFTFRGGDWINEPGNSPCVIEGEAEAVLLFALGRKPFDPDILTTNHEQAARNFKRHLSGP